MPKHILIVDDDALMRKSLAFNLEQAGYRVGTAESAEGAMIYAENDTPDLALLDIGLPGKDGLEALNLLKKKFAIPIIFVTGRRRKLDEVVGLELGADDYITKPFDMDILLAHIKAVLRRSQPQSGEQFTEQSVTSVGDITIDPVAHTVTLSGQLINLSPREFDLLNVLAIHANQVIPVEDLLRQVWGAEYIGEPQVVYVHIRWLREKIEGDPNHPTRINTVRGVGYKFVPRGENV
jgi:DNA-binding response OmpR family regulator